MQHEFSVNLVISSDVLEMGTYVLLETGTMAHVFQETVTAACAFVEMGNVASSSFLEMGTVACAFLEMGTLACAFLEMATSACACLEMGILAYALLEMEIDVYLVRIYVERETFDVQEMVTSLMHELVNDDSEEKVTFVTQRAVIFYEKEISGVKMEMDILIMKVNLSLNKVIS